MASANGDASPSQARVEAAWTRVVEGAAEADARFAVRLGDVEAAQRTTLSRLLADNAGTVFGGEHGFSGIGSAEIFRERVPISGYSAFKPYVERLIAGEAGVLTSEPVRFLEQTGGSSGGSKYIPYTDSSLRAFTDCLHPWLADLIRRRPGVTRGHAYFALSPVGRSLEARVGGHRLGSPVPFAYFGALRDSLIDLSAVPMELRLLADFETWQRRTCLDLLAAEDLALIWVWSPTYLTELLRAMRRDAASLLPELAARLAAAQPADAVRRRIAALEAALAGADPLGALWPRLDTISCWTDAASKGFADEIRTLFPGVFIQSKGLMSTEAAVSFPYGEGPGCLLAAGSGFFEFIDSSGAGRFAWQLEAGETYRLVVTTAAGLYRYDTHDMVEVTGFTGDTPRLRFLGREGLVSDLCGEKLTEAFVAGCLGEVGLAGEPYALLVATPTPRPGYRLYIEAGQTGIDGDLLGQSLDRALSANPQYEYARRVGQLDPLRAKTVVDLYGRLKRHRLRAGISIAGMKAPVLIGNADAGLVAAFEAAG